VGQFSKLSHLFLPTDQWDNLENCPTFDSAKMDKV
jgi:hypothetical protein